ncbi:hypothetical protein TomTYG45_23210 [Sphingobium sp. TomTYG45]
MDQLDQDFSVHPAPYPVIIGCIREGREPSIAEILRVAKRIRREAYPAAKKLSSRHRRGIVLSALAALGIEQER